MSAVNRKWITFMEVVGFVPLLGIVWAVWAMSDDPQRRYETPPVVEETPKPAPAPSEAETAAVAPAAKTPAPAATPAAGTYVVSGKISFEGEIPAGKPIEMNADPKCAAMHAGAKVLPEEIVGEGGGLANVFIYVKAGAKGKAAPPKTPAMIDQRGCQYLPHVVGVVVGQQLEIVSSDSTLHNINGQAKTNAPFNFAQPSPGTRQKKFNKPEIGMKLKCDVHPWMNAWIHVVENPYFGVSDKSGAFKIIGLPPGEYTIEAWHEKLGTQEKKITVGEADLADANFSFAAK